VTSPLRAHFLTFTDPVVSIRRLNNGHLCPASVGKHLRGRFRSAIFYA